GPGDRVQRAVPDGVSEVDFPGRDLLRIERSEERRRAEACRRRADGPVSVRGHADANLNGSRAGQRISGISIIWQTKSMSVRRKLTIPRVSRCWKAWKRFACDPRCTSVRPEKWAFTTWSTKSWTTRLTKPWRVTVKRFR